MNLKRLKHKSGSLYIDFMIGVFIAALCIIALLSMSVASSKITHYVKNSQIAAAVARGEIETIRSTKGYMLSNRTDASLISSPDELSLLPEGSGTLTIADSALVAGGKDITVTISWRTPNGTTKSLTFKTMVSPDGPTS